GMFIVWSHEEAKAPEERHVNLTCRPAGAFHCCGSSTINMPLLAELCAIASSPGQKFASRCTSTAEGVQTRGCCVLLPGTRRVSHSAKPQGDSTSRRCWL